MKLNPVVRATGIIGATAALVTGVTFAALSSSATLTNNTIASATANLKISSDANCATDTSHTTFSSSAVGFDFTGVVPGGSSSASETFCLWNDNTGGNAAALYLNVGMPVDATWTPVSSVDNAKVDMTITCDAGQSVTTSLHDAWFATADFTGSSLAAGSTTVCTTNVAMDSDAFSGSGVESDEFSLVFTGDAAAPVPAP